MTPTLSPAAERFSEFLLMLFQLIVAHAAQSGVKLPAAMIARIEAHLRGIGDDFARLAAAVEKGEPLPSRQERRTGLSRNLAKKLPLPLWERVGERGRPARNPEPQNSLIPPSPTRANGLTKTTGPPIFDPDHANPLARL